MSIFVIYFAKIITDVAVLGKNQTLFQCAIQRHYRVQSAVAQNLC